MCRRRFDHFAPWAVLLVLLGVGACKKKDPAKCQDGVETTKKALESRDFALANQWREYAYKNCADKEELSRLDQSIVDKQAEVEKEKQDKERADAEHKQLVGLFVKWVGDYKANAAGAGKLVSCDPPAVETKEHERFCTRSRGVSNKYQFVARYWEEDGTAAQFQTEPPQNVECDALGANRILKGGPYPKSLVECQLSGGALDGMFARINRTPDKTTVTVYSQKYLEALEKQKQAKN